jgi:lysophospholipase L1-like esterase
MNRKWKIILVISLLGNLTIVYVGYKALEYRDHINYFLDKYTQVVDEFSGREVYEKANDSLRTDDRVDNRIVFIGTQLVQNWDLDRYFTEYEAINRGIGGQLLAGFPLRFRPDVIELSPEAVIIEVSSYNFRPNNSVKQIQDYVADMAELAAAHSIVPVLTTVIPPRSDYSVYEHEDYAVKDSVILYNEWLVSLAAASGFKLADFYLTVTDDDGFLRDDLSVSRVDLNQRGYELISQVVLEILQDSK